MAAVVADDALRLARGAGGVEDVQRVGRFDRDTADGIRAGHRVVPVDVAQHRAPP